MISRSNVRRKRILVVEDNPGDVALMREAIVEGEFHYHLSIAKNGDNAISYLRNLADDTCSSLPDLILLDLNLPGKNGHEVLQEIKEDSRMKLIPVVILSSSDNERDVSRSYELNANSHVRKPGNLMEFANVLKVIETFWLKTAELP